MSAFKEKSAYQLRSEACPVSEFKVPEPRGGLTYIDYLTSKAFWNRMIAAELHDAVNDERWANKLRPTDRFQQQYRLSAERSLNAALAAEMYLTQLVAKHPQWEAKHDAR